MSIETILRVEEFPNSGAWNMALDEALLDLAAESEIASVRIYAWDRATLSLGYFQDVAEYLENERWNHLPAVKRLTGGGAILHHHEITYSVCLPARAFGEMRPLDLYSRVHQAVIDVLARHDCTVQFRGDLPGDDSEFLCFSRGDARDLVLNGKKVLGSAQRRRRGAVLQHGSLIMQKSIHAEHILGLLDSAAVAVSLGDLRRELGVEMANRIGIGTHTSEPIVPEHLRRRVEILLPRYGVFESR